MSNTQFLPKAYWLAAALALTALSSSGWADDSARLETYQSEGETYFAISLSADAQQKRAQSTAVVILFDTSASQQGAYRETALAALDTTLKNLRPDDRVQLLAVDLDVNPLTDRFSAPDAAELREATSELSRLVPLGSTDLERALRAAAQRLGDTQAEQRCVIYIGDGISIANLLDTATLDRLLATLRDARVAVNSYAIGPKVDAAQLAVLANHTGGNLYVAEPLAWQDEAEGVSTERAQAENQRNAQIVGKQLAQWTQAQVYWPQRVQLASELGETYPSVMPPLRSDRETILLGRTLDPLPAEVKVSITAEGSAGPTDFSWTITPNAPQEDNAFLAETVRTAAADGGLSLPTVGLKGLAETQRMLGARADNLTKLAERAAAAGDRQSASRIAQAVLRNDPGNVRARTVQNVVEGPDLATDAAGTSEPVADSDAGIRLVKQPDAEEIEDIDDAGLDREASAGTFLDEVEQERRVFAEMLSTEIRNTILDARKQMTSDPRQAIQDLKLTIETVRRASDLDEGKRAVLLDKLQNALRESRYQASLKDELDRQREQELASIRDRKLLNERLMRRIDRKQQLMNRFEALMDEQRYEEAGEVAQFVEQLEPQGVTPRVATHWARFSRNHHLQQVARAARWNAFFDALYQTELSHIPFPDNPPIVYPDAAYWEELTNRRKDKYSAADLSARSKAEERISSALREPLKAPLDYVDQPLSDILNTLSDDFEIPIVFDDSALDEVAVSPETEITVNLYNITLRSALNLMLKKPGVEDLTYVIDEEVLLITTEDRANETLKVKVYPVADLVLPIQNLGISGGLGGGGGGGQGGGGGGQGGGGGGFGGGGGGQGGGGQGGGGGGGFFNLPDDLTDTPPKVTQPVVESTDEAASADAAETVAPNWAQRFETRQADPAEVRRTVRDLMKQGETAQVVDLIQSALRHGQPQSWMYESLGIAMELEGHSKREIERVVMSACDFSTSPDELMLIARYLSHIGLDKRAVDVYRQVVKVSQLHYEAYALGLRAAQRAEDRDGIRWATVGILQHAWPKEQEEVYRTAVRVAKATLEELQLQGEESTYGIYRGELEEAMQRDCVVQVSWSGSADIDLIVEEPGGTICSLQEPRTTGGGICLGDNYAEEEGVDGDSEGLSEAYVCTQGFSGTYQARIRKVWGKVVAGKVTVDVYLNYGTPEQRHERQRIEVPQDADAMVVFTLEAGRRSSPIEDEQLAVAVRRQDAISRAALAQHIGSLSDPSAVPFRPGDNDIRRQLALAGRGGAVGFQPIIITLPQGTQMNATGVVSHDRRYVRVSVGPSFTGIGNVQTFTFAGSADETGGGGGGGGMGGGGGGGI